MGKSYGEQKKEYGKKVFDWYAKNDLSKVKPVAPKAKVIQIEVKKSVNPNELMRQHLEKPYGERNRGANWLK